jgi:hypothetical protein
MFVMAIAAVVLLLAAGIIAVASAITTPPSKIGPKIAVALAAIAVVLIAALSVGQQRVCTTLGGEWVPDTQACKNEWGGNGANG